jgi:hypothetical protein
LHEGSYDTAVRLLRVIFDEEDELTCEQFVNQIREHDELEFIFSAAGLRTYDIKVFKRRT